MLEFLARLFGTSQVGTAAKKETEDRSSTVWNEWERLRVTLDCIGDGVIATDADGWITLLNPVAAALTGWHNDEAVGKPLPAVFTIINERTRQPGENPIVTALREGRIVALANHTILVARDGTERPIDDSAAPIQDRHGQVSGVVLIFRDVTERRRAERANRFLASIVESSDDAIIGKDVNGIITSWNPAAERLFGYAAAEAIGRPVAMLAPADRVDEMPAILNRIKRGERVEHFDTVRRAKDGRLLPISLTVSPIRNGEGQVIGASKIARDISERCRAEAALQEEKGRLQATLTGIGDAVIATDAKQRITLMNPVAQTLTGWNSEATGRPLEDIFRIVNEETRRPAPNPVERVIRDGTICGLANHTVLIAKDGTESPIDDSAAPIRDPDGRILGVVLVFRDVTERRRADAKLRQQADLLDLAHDAIVVRSKQGRILFWNPAAEELYGWSKDEALGQDTHSLFETSFPQPLAKIEAELEQHGRWEGVLKHHRKDGTPLVVSARWAMRKGEPREPGIVLEINRDITEQKRFEEESRKNAEIFKLAHSIGQVGHWEWNSLTDQNKWSPEIESLYGLAPGTFEGTYDAWTRLIHPDDLPRAEEDVRRSLETGTYRSEFRVIWPNGSVHWLEARANVFKDGHDKPIRIMGVNMDVTVRKRIEETLKHDDRRKDEFLATLAHELRNPLAPLRNSLELLNRAPDDAEISDASRKIMERQLGHMVRLIDDLMDISRVTSGKLQLRKERIELAATVQSAVEETRPLIEASSHELTITLPQEPVILNADPTRLSQIFSNLLNNAAKYTEKGGHIWLTAESADGEVVVTVRDTGIGIDAAHLPSIFQMFSQATSALERSEGGLGIGLALVRGLVRLPGGKIEAQSAGAGLGSEFTVRLPVVEGQRESPVNPSNAGTGSRPSEQKSRILVVDDNVDSTASLAWLLRRLGHEIETAHDGLEAVQAAAVFRPQVVLLDIGLPKLNGYEAAKRIRELPGGREMVLIALSGWGQEKDKQMALDAGFDHHLTKPVEPAALTKLLAQITQS